MSAEEIIKDKIIELYHNRSKINQQSAVGRQIGSQIKILEEVLEQINKKDDKATEIDITNEYYHKEFDTVTCPHCGRTLNRFSCMPHHYCYVCGGKFGDINIDDE